jgi:hypothetical protein
MQRSFPPNAQVRAGGTGPLIRTFLGILDARAMYRAGQRDEAQISRYATFKAISQKPNTKLLSTV